MGNLSTESGIGRQMAVKRPLELAEDHAAIDLKKPKINVMEVLQLIDINDHCLWHIFEFLDVVDLVNIAEAHKRFIPVANSVFRRLNQKTKKLTVYLASFHYCLSNKRCLCPANVSIEALFRHFGHVIPKATINFLGGEEVDIETLLQKHCSDSMVELNLTFCDENNFQSIDKPFTALKKLQLAETTLGPKLSQMNIWFPNIQRLELTYVQLSQPELFEVNFPELKHLEIFNQDLPIESIRKMLCKNPQLKVLLLQTDDYDRNFIESLSQSVSGLEELKLWAPQDRFADFEDHKFHFEMVKKFTLNTCSYRGDYLVNVPFTFGALQELRFDGFNQFKGPILDFVMQSKSVEKLHLVPFTDDVDDLMPEDLQNVVDALPKLTVLEFCADEFSADDIMKFLKVNKKLSHVMLLFNEMPHCQHLKEDIRKQWDLLTKTVGKITETEIFTYAKFWLKRKNSN